MGKRRLAEVGTADLTATLVRLARHVQADAWSGEPPSEVEKAFAGFVLELRARDAIGHPAPLVR